MNKLTLNVLGTLALGTQLASAAEASTPIDGGNTAWILTATALVLFMTMPGLALFYGGLVRGRNVLSVMAQCTAIGCVASLLWIGGLYSLAFKGDGGWIGTFDLSFMKPESLMQAAPNTTIPEAVFLMFQMTFAIITPGLYVGAVVERMKFGSIVLFSALWLALVYAPVCHWVWGGGWAFDMGVKDLAGGIVVHATAGTTALGARVSPSSGSSLVKASIWLGSP
jgi:Amt family ammonium transporter